MLLLIPPIELDSACRPTFPQVQVIWTLTVLPAVAVLTSVGVSVTVYDPLGIPAAVIMLEMTVVTLALVADAGIAALSMVAMIERFSYYVVSRDLNVDRDDMLDTLTSILHVGVFGGTRRGQANGLATARTKRT